MRTGMILMLSLLAAASPAFAAPTPSHTFPMIKGHPAARVTLNGKWQGDLLLDTGAGISGITEPIARRLGLQIWDHQPDETAMVVRGKALRFVTLSEIRIDGFKTVHGKFTFEVMPEGYLKGRAYGADGILGLDFLKAYSILLDFRRQETTLLAESRWSTALLARLGFSTDHSTPLIPLTVRAIMEATGEKDIPADADLGVPLTFRVDTLIDYLIVRLTLDTGADVTLLGADAARRLGLPASPAERKESLYNWVSLNKIQPKTLSVGNYTVAAPAIRIYAPGSSFVDSAQANEVQRDLPEPARQLLGDLSHPVLFGLNSLRLFGKILLDLPGDTLYLGRPPAALVQNNAVTKRAVVKVTINGSVYQVPEGSTVDLSPGGTVTVTVSSASTP